MLIGLALLGVACRTFDPKHPWRGQPSLQPAPQPTYWVWAQDNGWRVRVSSGTAHVHRFQGSVAGVNGGVVDWQPTRPDSKDRIALVGDALQFDLEVGVGEVDGFDVRAAGGCARFDLYVDGRYRPERVRLGQRGQVVRHVPFERCP